MASPDDYRRVDLGKPDQGSYKNHGDSSQLGGDYGPVRPDLYLPEPARDSYPNIFGGGYSADNPQFSQDKESDPQRLLEQSRQTVDLHSDINYSQGLCQPIATLGQHAWLRDGLAEEDVRGTGYGKPDYDADTPFDKGRE